MKKIILSLFVLAFATIAFSVPAFAAGNWSGMVNSTPSTYNGVTKTYFNITLDEEPANITLAYLEENSTGTARNYTMTNFSTKVWYVNFTQGAGNNKTQSWKVYWRENGVTDGTWNTSDKVNYTIYQNTSAIATLINLNLTYDGTNYINRNVSNPVYADYYMISYGYFNTTLVGAGSIWLTKNGVNATNSENIRQTTSGENYYKVNTTDAWNFSNLATGSTYYFTVTTGGGGGGGGTGANIICGDNTCSTGSETCTSCPSDCGTCIVPVTTTIPNEYTPTPATGGVQAFIAANWTYIIIGIVVIVMLGTNKKKH